MHLVVGSYVRIKTGSQNRYKLESEIVTNVGSKAGTKNSVLAFLKCMGGSVLVFIKCMDGSVKCMDGSLLPHLRSSIQSVLSRFPQSGNSGVP